MRPIQLEGAVQYHKPTDWDDEKDGKCAVLPVVRNGNTFTSVWTFTDQERQDIAMGKNLALTIAGSGQPPVMLSLVNVQGEIAPGFETIEDVVQRIMDANPDKVEQARLNRHLMPWFVGQTLKAMNGSQSALRIRTVVERKFNMPAPDAERAS